MAQTKTYVVAETKYYRANECRLYLPGEEVTLPASEKPSRLWGPPVKIDGVPVDIEGKPLEPARLSEEKPAADKGGNKPARPSDKSPV